MANSTISVKLVVDKSELEAALKAKPTVDTSSMSSGISTAMSGALIAGATAAAAAVTSVLAAAVTKAGEKQQLMAASMVAYKNDAQAAAAALKDATDYASKSPLQTKTVVAAQSNYMLQTGKQLDTKTREGIGNAAAQASLQGNAGVDESFKDVTKVLALVQQAGKANNEWINMLRDRGIPIVNQLSTDMGMTVGQVTKLASEGRISAEQFNSSFLKLTTDGGALAGISEAFGKTIPGLMSTFQDSVDASLQQLGEQFVPLAESALDLTKVLSDRQWGETLEWVGQMAAELQAEIQDPASQEAIGSLMAMFQELFKVGITAVIQGVKLFVELLTNPLIKFVIDAITLSLQGWSMLLKVVVDILAMANEGWKLIWSEIDKIIQSTAVWREALEGVKTMFDAIAGSASNVQTPTGVAPGGSSSTGGAFDSGLVTGPSSNNGGSAEDHIDFKFLKTLSIEQVTKYMDAVAMEYATKGRVMEFSNPAVAGEVYNPNDLKRQDLIRRAFEAHSHSRSEKYESLDFYVPSKGKNRFDKSAEGAPIVLPNTGGQVAYASGGNYGNYAVLTDSSGQAVMKAGHGDDRKPLPANRMLSGGGGGKETQPASTRQGKATDSGSTTAGGDRGAEVMSFFMSQGFSKAAAAVLAGTVKQESGFNASAVGDGGLANGLFQWHPDRRDSSYKHGDFNSQLQYALKEMDTASGGGAGFSQKLRKAGSIEDANRLVNMPGGWIRPGEQGDRLAYAQQYYQQGPSSGGSMPKSGIALLPSGKEAKDVNAKQDADVKAKNKLEQEKLELAYRQKKNSYDKNTPDLTKSMDELAYKRDKNNLESDQALKALETESSRDPDAKARNAGLINVIKANKKADAVAYANAVKALTDNKEIDAANLKANRAAEDSQTKATRAERDRKAPKDKRKNKVLDDTADAELDYTRTMEDLAIKAKQRPELIKAIEADRLAAKNTLAAKLANLGAEADAIAEEQRKKEELHELRTMEQYHDEADKTRQLANGGKVLDLQLRIAQAAGKPGEIRRIQHEQTMLNIAQETRQATIEHQKSIKAIEKQIAEADAEGLSLDNLLRAKEDLLKRQDMIDQQAKTKRLIAETGNNNANKDALKAVTDQLTPQPGDARSQLLRRNAGEFAANAYDRTAGTARINEKYNGMKEQVADLKLPADETAKLNTEIDQLKQVDLSNLNNQFKTLGETIADNMKQPVADAFMSILDGTKSVGEALDGLLKQFLNMVLQMATNQLITSVFGSVFGGGVPRFAEGNVESQLRLERADTGSQPFLAVLNADEIVLNKAQSKAFRQMVPRYAEGTMPGLSLASSGNGETSVQLTINNSGGGDMSDSQAAQLRKQVEGMIQATILKQRRPGGLLSAT